MIKRRIEAIKMIEGATLKKSTFSKYFSFIIRW